MRDDDDLRAARGIVAWLCLSLVGWGIGAALLAW